MQMSKSQIIDRFATRSTLTGLNDIALRKNVENLNLYRFL